VDVDVSKPAETVGREGMGRPPRRFRALRFLAPALGLLAAAGLVGLLIYGVIARSPDTRIDDSLARNQPIPAPSYRLAVLRRGTLGPRLERRVGPALADGRVSPSELRGTPYVLNIWASWCVPCRDEAPELVREWRRMRPRGVLFVGLDMQDTAEDARRFMDHYGIDYLTIKDPTNDTSHRYGATGVPETFFISARGDIVNHVIGVVTPAQLRGGIDAAVSGRPEAARQGGEQRPAR
jgi:cytochrome c biogenesis protein CcmG, thiol:disulfide interchange protein DsbE